MNSLLKEACCFKKNKKTQHIQTLTLKLFLCLPKLVIIAFICMMKKMYKPKVQFLWACIITIIKYYDK